MKYVNITVMAIASIIGTYIVNSMCLIIDGNVAGVLFATAAGILMIYIGWDMDPSPYLKE